MSPRPCRLLPQGTCWGQYQTDRHQGGMAQSPPACSARPGPPCSAHAKHEPGTNVRQRQDQVSVRLTRRNTRRSRLPLTGRSRPRRPYCGTRSSKRPKRQADDSGPPVPKPPGWAGSRRVRAGSAHTGPARGRAGCPAPGRRPSPGWWARTPGWCRAAVHRRIQPLPVLAAGGRGDPGVLRDLRRHAQDFAERHGFTYTVLSTGTGDVIGCVYIYPPRGDGPGGTAAGRHAVVRSWVRADHAGLDPVLYQVVLAWLERDWPFRSIEYAPRA
jgi:hypothetical protein